MTQNIYDDEQFFEGYSRLPRSVEGLDGAPEWPALRALLPDLCGLDVLRKLACEDACVGHECAAQPARQRQGNWHEHAHLLASRANVAFAKPVRRLVPSPFLSAAAVRP